MHPADIHVCVVQVALRVFYQSENTAFVTTFFNETITIVEKSVLIDSEQIFMWLIILGLALIPGKSSPCVPCGWHLGRVSFMAPFSL
jgi:hypothetical protein